MKVVYVIPGMGGGGGAERSLAAMVPTWVESMELQLVTFSQRDALVQDLGIAGVEHTNLTPNGRWSVTSQLTALIKQSHPDLVHTTLFEADLVGRLAGVASRVPVSASLVNVNYGKEQMGVPGQRAIRLRAAQAADAATARSVSRFHALTEHVAHVMSRRLLVAPSRIDVVPRGRDEAALGGRTDERRALARATLGVGDRPLIVATARHEWQKGLDVLVRAVPQILRQVPNAQVLIGGRSGTQTEELEQLVADHGLDGSVRFIGPRSDVPELMCAADVFCVPSRWEGFGSILVEAMALEAPTVSTDIGPVREVAGPTPWLTLVPPGNPSELARGVIGVLADPTGSASSAALGRERFLARYTAEAVAAEMVQFFDRAVRTSRWGGGSGRD